MTKSFNKSKENSSSIIKPRVLAIIPARGGSKSIPRKNIKIIAGKPLLYWMLNEALESKVLTRVVVSSEDDEILEVARQYGGEKVVLRRPEEYAQDTTPDIPVLQHAVKAIEAEEGYRFDYVVMLHCTSPLILARDIDNVVQKLIDTHAHSVVSVYEINDFHPKKLMKIEGDRLFPYVPEFLEKTTSRRQDVIPVYKRNGGIYASRREIVMDWGRVWGDDVRAYIMPDEQSVDINSWVDFWAAEMLLERRLNKDQK